MHGNPIATATDLSTVGLRELAARRFSWGACLAITVADIISLPKKLPLFRQTVERIAPAKLILYVVPAVVVLSQFWFSTGSSAR